MDIEFTRADTQFIKFDLKDAEGNPLELTDNDVLYFTIKQSPNSNKILLQKKYPDDIKYQDGYYYFVINSAETADLAYGTYQYDIELKSGDYVKTLSLGSITLTEEITFRRDE